jgi:hypothetical protein
VEGDKDVGSEGLKILDAKWYHDRSMMPLYSRKSEQEVQKVGVDA